MVRLFLLAVTAIAVAACAAPDTFKPPSPTATSEQVTARIAKILRDRTSSAS